MASSTNGVVSRMSSISLSSDSVGRKAARNPSAVQGLTNAGSELVLQESRSTVLPGRLIAFRQRPGGSREMHPNRVVERLMRPAKQPTKLPCMKHVRTQARQVITRKLARTPGYKWGEEGRAPCPNTSTPQ